MRKMIAVLLAGVMVLSLGACGSKDAGAVNIIYLLCLQKGGDQPGKPVVYHSKLKRREETIGCGGLLHQSLTV